MGADQSSSSGKAEREKFSQNEKNRFMQQQKASFDQRYAEVAREAARKEVEKIMKEKQELQSRQKANLSNNSAAPSNVPTLTRETRNATGVRLQVELTSSNNSFTIRAAPKEEIPIVKEKQELFSRQNAYLSNNHAVQSNMPTSTSLEKRSSPYNFTSHDLTSPTLVPSSSTCKPPSLYPQLPNASNLSRNSVSPSSTASMKSTVTLQSVPCTNHPLVPPSAPTSVNNNLPASSCSSSLKNNKPLPPTNYNNLNAYKTAAFNPPAPHDVRNDRNYPTSTPLCAGNPMAPRAPVAPSAPPMARDRSASRNRNKFRGKVNKDDELNCPTCKTRYGVNIYQCQRGHSSCYNCKMGQRACGICGLPITDMRNITLEAYVCERKVQCPNSKDGCNLYIKLVDIETHAKECPFGQMLCPLAAIFGQCTWRGKQSEMSSHFDKAHQMHRQGNVDTEMVLLSLTSDSHIVHLVDVGIYSFLFHARVSKSEGKIYMVVQFIGTRQSASKWSYEIHIFNKGQPRRKYQFTDICHNVNNAVNNIFSNSECATIPLSYANTFINENGFLKYKFYIKKNVEDDGNLGNKTNNVPGGHSEDNNYKNNQSDRDRTNEDVRRNNNFRNNYRGRGRGGNNNRFIPNSGNTQRCHSASSEENNLSANNQSEASGVPKNQKIYWNRGRGGARRKPLINN